MLNFISGCGVKAAPLSPKETVLKSYIQNYTEQNEDNNTHLINPSDKKKK